MASLTTRINGYPVSIDFNSEYIIRCYIGSNSGIDVWPILDNEFRIEVFDVVFGARRTQRMTQCYTKRTH